MQFSAVLNMFIVKTYLNSVFTNDLKMKENFSKMFKVTEYAALRVSTVLTQISPGDCICRDKSGCKPWQWL